MLDFSTGTISWAPVAAAIDLTFSNETLVSKTTNSAQVSWNVSPGARGYVEYGPTTSYGGTTALETRYLTFHSQPISSLASNTTYHWRAVGIATDGTVDYGSDQTFTTDADVTVTPTTALVYGPVNADQIGNCFMWAGTAPGPWASMRFRANRTGYIRSVGWYQVTGSGYSIGTPVCRIRLVPDIPTGSPSHLPDRNTTLATTATFNGNIAITHKTDTFLTPYQVTQDTLYHVLFENLSSDITNNGFSFNCFLQTGNGVSPEWGVGQVDYAAIHDGYSNNGVAGRPGFFPIMDLSYSDTAGGAITSRQGRTHMQLQNPYLITGNSQVREIFTVSGSSVTVDGVWPYIEHVSGTGNLTVSLETAAGSAIDSASFPYTDFVTGDGTRYNGIWPGTIHRNFAGGSHVLALGSTYVVRFSAAAGTTYMMEAFLKGSAYGFDSSTCFPDGYFQYTTGGASGTWSSNTSEDGQVFLSLV